MINQGLKLLGMLALLVTLGACVGSKTSGAPRFEIVEVLLTSESGHRIDPMDVATFQSGQAVGTVITVLPDQTKQTIDGIGSSFTESSAFVLAHLDPQQRREVMLNAFGEAGANFSLTRTHIGSCDFTVDGKYSYADDPRTVNAGLDSGAFSIAPDTAGFDPAVHPGIKDAGYDLLPMIQEALSLKRSQRDSELRIIASAWTAPPWMKDIQDWYVSMSADNNWQGTGGALKPGHYSTYADYLVKYLDAYQRNGVAIWGLTPVNEPHGNNGQWESMHFSPESQNEFIKHHLGPRLRSSAHPDTRILIYDQNRDGLEEWTNTILGDPETAGFVHGVAVHWYSSTFKVYEETFDRVQARFPDIPIVHTEGCIDDLGKAAPDGIQDPVRFKESGWFQNDAFWWNAKATDWAYSAPWASPSVEDHPIYTPVHRYARNIIVSLDHWVSGWVDWNLVLDRHGGPNHVGNFCGAPIMIDTETGEVYYTPIYFVLAQFSRTIRPGDRALQTELMLDGLDSDALHACATTNEAGIISVQLLNTTKLPIACNLQIGGSYADITVPANAIQTVRVATLVAP
ncbi:MAG: glycoside hydrolase family 30 protein [Planctomycetota bacterium]|jgi:glucosylceramidase